MKNIIHDKSNLEFMENNINELSTYIGEKEEYYIERFKNEKNKINFAAFILGPLWLGYRKMYLESFIIVVVLTILFLIQLHDDSIIFNIAKLGLNIFLGLRGNYLYFMSLKRRIIKKEENYGVSKKGMLCVLLLLLLILPLLSIMGFTSFFLTLATMNR